VLCFVHLVLIVYCKADHSKQAGAVPGHVDLASLYGDRLKRGTIEPALRQDGTIAAELKVKNTRKRQVGCFGLFENKKGEFDELVEGLTPEEIQALYQRATHRKD
jgi:hypothetical protein